MGEVGSRLIVCFEDPFWIGVLNGSRMENWLRRK